MDDDKLHKARLTFTFTLLSRVLLTFGGLLSPLFFYLSLRQIHAISTFSGGTIGLKVVGLLLACGALWLFMLGLRMTKNRNSVVNWAMSVRHVTRETGNQQELQQGFKRALRGEFAD